MLPYDYLDSDGVFRFGVHRLKKATKTFLRQDVKQVLEYPQCRKTTLQPACCNQGKRSLNR